MVTGKVDHDFLRVDVVNAVFDEPRRCLLLFALAARVELLLLVVVVVIVVAAGEFRHTIIFIMSDCSISTIL